MTFEKWREKLRHLRSTKNLASLELTNCIADWKDDRAKLIGALEDNEHFKNAVEKFCEEKQGQQNMTDKLEGFSTGWIAARAVLAEVKEQK